jgi:thiosulfate/3-mercaptopyruvate sulfurtransferase
VTEEDLEMSRSDVLVDAEWVETHNGDPGIVLVEVDEDTSAYDKGHIRNAVKIDWKKDLQDPVRRDFVDRAGFEALLSERGISNDDTVVLYGGNNNWFAAYAYWYFKLYGHQNVKLLDGGRKKWELDSRELVTEVPQRAATSAPRMSSPAGCWPRRTSRRSRPSAAVTCPRPGTCPGPRRPRMTGRSSPTTS